MYAIRSYYELCPFISGPIAIGMGIAEKDYWEGRDSSGFKTILASKGSLDRQGTIDPEDIVRWVVPPD